MKTEGANRELNKNLLKTLLWVERVRENVRAPNGREKAKAMVETICSETAKKFLTRTQGMTGNDAPETGRGQMGLDTVEG